MSKKRNRRTKTKISTALSLITVLIILGIIVYLSNTDTTLKKGIYIVLGIVIIAIIAIIATPVEEEIGIPGSKDGKRFKKLYQAKPLLTECEREFGRAIKTCTPIGFIVIPQVCLAAVIKKTDINRYANELFRIIDFGIFDRNFNITCLIEINDLTHLRKERAARDRKVRRICKAAEIPLITLWTDHGVQKDYIQKRITEALSGAENTEI